MNFVDVRNRVSGQIASVPENYLKHPVFGSVLEPVTDEPEAQVTVDEAPSPKNKKTDEEPAG